MKSSLTKDVTILVNESGIESAKTKQARESGIEIVNGFTILFGEKIWHFPSGQMSVLKRSLTLSVAESPVSQATVAEAADQLETSTRSISSKLRKMGFEVELASAASGTSFTEGQEATLRAFVTDNSGEYTYAQIAEHFEGGAFSPKSIQGKILSMELTDHVAPAPKVEAVRTYTAAEEATFVSMVNDGAFVEAIADALGPFCQQYSR